MMNDWSSLPQPSVPAGLCDRCRHAGVVTNDRGSRFVRCARADADPRFPKYPRLPVRECAGFAPIDAGWREDR
jgi:hypothetical protein